MKKFWLIIFLVAMVLPAACTTPVGPSTGNGLRIITEVYPPYNFVDEHNEVTGQSTEIVRAIMQKTGTGGAIEVLPLSEALDLAGKGPDIAVYSVNRTPQREDMYRWVGPIGFYEQAFYTRKGTAITLNRLEDAKNVASIGVYKGDAGAEFLADNGFTNLDESLTDSDALKKLMAGTVQIWLGNKEGLAITAGQAGVDPADLVEISTVVIHADLYIAFSKDVDKSTVEAWQVALDALKQERDIDDKTMIEKIQAKYSDSAAQ